MIAEVTSSFVNSVLFKKKKKIWILKEEHLLGFADKRAQVVFVLDLPAHPDFLL